MGKKILLISPPRTGTWNSAIFSACEPLGLAYLAAVLEKNNFEVEILDCFILGQKNKVPRGNFIRMGLNDEDIKRYIKKAQADIVGITNMFTSLSPDSLEVARLAKDVNPECLVVMGGAHATVEYESILRNKNVDVVVLGEGEETFLEVVQKFANKQSISEVKGIVLKHRGTVKCNPPREPVTNLDELPFPARHSLPMDLYFKDQLKTTFGLAMRFPVAIMITSRGCPYNCIFCSTSKVWKKWRPRGVKSIVDEIELLINEYGVKEVAFEDDNFIVDRKRVVAICDEILKRRLSIKWTVPAGISTWIIDKETLAKMKKAGFYRACFPVESGSKETLKFIRKPVNLEKVKEIIDFANRIGLWTAGNFIFGFPDEKPESVNKTLEFAQKSNLDVTIFYVAQPYAGSDLYSIYEKRGLLKSNSEGGSSVVDTIYDTMYYSSSELSDLRSRASQEYLRKRALFYLTPKGFLLNLLPKINSYEKFCYFLKIIKIAIPNLHFSLRFLKRKQSKESGKIKT